MSQSFKARAGLLIEQSDLSAGIITFMVDPADVIIFRARLLHLVKSLQKKDRFAIHKHTFALTVGPWFPQRSNQQNRLYRLIIGRICTDENSEAYGSDPDNIHEGILARAALSYGYPTTIAAGVKVPVRSTESDTKTMNILIEVARVVAGESGAYIEDIKVEAGEN